MSIHLSRIQGTVLLVLCLLWSFITEKPILVKVFFSYLLMVRMLRFRNYDRIHRFKNLESMTEKDKLEAFHLLGLYEFPFIWTLSLEFALFRTYAIPTISKVLVASKEFQTCCGRRYDDTDLILREIMENGLNSDRGQAALNRMNFLHSNYQITNEDFRYVLSTFVLEPPRWFNKFEWRKLTKLEEEINYDFWRRVGEGMGIQDIPENVEKYTEFNISYERDFMVYQKSNRLIADATIDLFASIAPKFMKPLVVKAIVALMDDDLREAMGFEKEPQWLSNLLFAILKLRGFLILHFFPPRIFSAARTPKLKNASGRYVPLFHKYDPIYKDGYKIEDLGPEKFVGKCPALSSQKLAK